MIAALIMDDLTAAVVACCQAVRAATPGMADDDRYLWSRPFGACRDGMSIWLAHEKEWVNPQAPINRVTVGVQAGIMGQGPDLLQLWQLRQGVFRTAMMAALRPGWKFLPHGTVEDRLVQEIKELAGAMDYAATRGLS